MMVVVSGMCEPVKVADDYVLVAAQLVGEPWQPERGEHRLVLGVLHRAVADLLGDDIKLREDARMYFAGEIMASGALYPFEFGAICELLGWEQDYVRGLIAALKGSPPWSLARRRVLR